ncbi:MAG: hypothetical protein RL703_1012 [Pseudomonadota bacterium]
MGCCLCCCAVNDDIVLAYLLNDFKKTGKPGGNDASVTRPKFPGNVLSVCNADAAGNNVEELILIIGKGNAPSARLALPETR